MLLVLLVFSSGCFNLLFLFMLLTASMEALKGLLVSSVGGEEFDSCLESERNARGMVSFHSNQLAIFLFLFVQTPRLCSCESP